MSVPETRLLDWYDAEYPQPGRRALAVQQAYDELIRLRAVNAELVEALDFAIEHVESFSNPALRFSATKRDGTPKLRFTPNEVMHEIRALTRTIGEEIRNRAAKAKGDQQ